LNKQEFTKIISKIEKEEGIFSKKAYLDTLSFPPNIVGQQKKTEELARLLLGYKQGYVVPLVSVYGRSGSGKSTIAKFVCENIGVPFCFVNLRKAKTVFGAANLILAELGQANLKSAQGLNLAVEKIGDSIISKLQEVKKNFFILVLDEYDVLFYDKRGKPSDFIYKLIVLEESLREKDLMLCVVTISNNVLSDYELDDRVRSRIGTSEIFFEPYSQGDVLKILQERAKEAFSVKIDDKVLEKCAVLSSEGHGDARRAIDLLRVAAELAVSKNETFSESHVDLASDELQKDRIGKVLENASYHFKLACAGLARITYLTEEAWHSTSVLYNQYCKIIRKETKPLSYRRVSELLTELENTGLVVSPEMVGLAAFPQWWKGIVKAKIEHEYAQNYKGLSFGRKPGAFDGLLKTMSENNKLAWEKYLGLD